ncbi:hypothetical protein HQO90_15180 [Rhodococcus fascians]|nr:hypothetical protein [Rhodococcus fascians]MBY4059657.1 hypothetical protein [Rhodococcus fascians]MBY4068970.1 hypothetical protein [Rhodococcus fascians]
MAEGSERDFARAADLFGERASGVDVGAQNERVDEHADDVVERCVTAAGDRSTDGDVLGARQSGQQHGQCGVDDHEQRCVVGMRQSGQALVHIGRHVESDGGALVGLATGSRPVGRQIELVG